MFRPVLTIFRLRQPEDGQYRPKHVVVHYIVIKYTSCDTVVFDYIQFSTFHTHTTGMTHFLVHFVVSYCLISTYFAQQQLRTVGLESLYTESTFAAA